MSLGEMRECADSRAAVTVLRCFDKFRGIVAVSDGMGGHSSGEVASFMTVKCLCDEYPRIVASDGELSGAVILEINRTVSQAAQSNPEYKGMGATLCGFAYCDNKIIGFNVGDSRLYRFCGGELERLSRDHTEGQRLKDLGLLTDAELESFPNRKAIYKYIGMKTDLVADVFEIAPCEKGSLLLLCTDGLSDAICESELAEILGRDLTLKEKGEVLIDTALERKIGHGDNVTIILTGF